jgi:uncharacterized protein YrzB (UPF0473 family)
MNKDYITVKTSDGKEEQVELVLTANKNNKKYLLYRNSNNELFASYITNEDDILHNDLSEEEYNMLEKLLKEANV